MVTSKLVAFRADTCFTQFFSDKVTLKPRLLFLPKIVLNFNLAQSIDLLVFSQTPLLMQKMHYKSSMFIRLYYFPYESHSLFLCYLGP